MQNYKYHDNIYFKYGSNKRSHVTTAVLHCVQKKTPHLFSFITSLAPLQRVLNTAARIILDLRPGDHVTRALRELAYTGCQWLPGSSINSACWLTKWRSVKRRSTLQISWRRLQKSLPDLHSVRQPTAISLSQEAKTENRRTCFFCLWNQLPTELKLCQSTALFKRKLKTFLFTASYGVSENNI